MIKRLILVGGCVLLAGCAPSQTWQRSLFSSGPAPAQSTQQLAQQPSAESTEPGLSFGKMLSFVGFQKKEPGQEAAVQPATAGMLSPEVVALGNLIQEVAGRAAELNANDPAEVTQQKADGILQALQGWDGQVARSQASGSLSESTSRLLNSFVAQIRGQADRLVKYAPTAENIAAVQQTASNLDAAGKTLGGIMQQVNSIPNAWASQPSSAPVLR